MGRWFVSSSGCSVSTNKDNSIMAAAEVCLSLQCDVKLIKCYSYQHHMYVRTDKWLVHVANPTSGLQAKIFLFWKCSASFLRRVWYLVARPRLRAASMLRSRLPWLQAFGNAPPKQMKLTDGENLKKKNPEHHILRRTKARLWLRCCYQRRCYYQWISLGGAFCFPHFLRRCWCWQQHETGVSNIKLRYDVWTHRRYRGRGPSQRSPPRVAWRTCETQSLRPCVGCAMR